MRVTILFPSDYFDPTRVDEQFQAEYAEVIKLPAFEVAFYNHDAFIEGKKLQIYPGINNGLCIARTWMLKPYEYLRLHNNLGQMDVRLINTPDEYSLMHLFPNIYPSIMNATPRAMFFPDSENVIAESINRTFKRFMIKDFVKSVKGYDFPACIGTPVSQNELDCYIKKFIELRGGLFTGGIAIKEYVDLKQYGDCPNEYRVFYFDGHIITISRNSNQQVDALYLPVDIAETYAHLGSHYYTIDFGELACGGFTILETGDGQVSGLSPNQDIFKYYDGLRHIIEQERSDEY